MVRNRLLVALFAALLLVSCSKKEPVKSAEEKKAEMDQAAKVTRENSNEAGFKIQYRNDRRATHDFVAGQNAACRK